jgi:WD40 repeat protein
VTQTPTSAPPGVEPPSPYVGLSYFTENDAQIFFGRDRERTTIMGNLRTARLTILYAGSGAGKSSLLRAGVAARVRELAARSRAERVSARYLPVVFSSWDDDPTAALIAEIEKLARTAAPAIELPRDGLAEAIEAAAAALDAKLLVILDQFEEYFLYRSREPRPERFADELARCVNRPDLRANFLIALREDAYAGLGDLFKARIPDVYGNYLPLEYLDRDAAREAIVKPIERFNSSRSDAGQVEIEEELVDAVLDQVAHGKIVIGESGRGSANGAEGHSSRFVETPFMQLVLKRLWETELALRNGLPAGEPLRLRAATLESLGGAETIIGTHLDEAMQNLDRRARDVAGRVFQFLVTRSGTKVSYTAGDLADVAGLRKEQVEPLLEHLAGDVRILRRVAAPPGEDTGPRFEIFHDVLAAAVLDWRKRYVQRKERRKVQLAVALTACAVLVAGGLAVLARWAFEQASAARSLTLATSAIAALSSDPQEAIRLALQALREKSTPQAEDALRQALSESRVTAVLPHDDWVNDAAFSSDGTKVLTASDDDTAGIWNASTGKEIHVLRGHEGDVVSARFSHDDRRVVTGGKDGTARIWDASTGKQLHVLRGHAGWVGSAAFSPADDLVVTTAERAVRVWNAATGEERPTLDGFRQPGSAAVFSFDGRYVAAGTWDGTVRIWNLTTTAKPVVLEVGAGVVDVAFDRSGKLLAAGSGDNKIRVWHWQRKGAEPRVLSGHAAAVGGVEFSRDGRRILSNGGSDKTARIWDLGGGETRVLRGHTDWVNQSVFSADERFVLTASGDGTARVWDAGNGWPVAVLHGHSDIVFAAAFGPVRPTTARVRRAATADAGLRAVTASADGTAMVWDLGGARELHPGGLFVNDAAFSADGRHVVTAGARGAQVWAAVDGKPESKPLAVGGYAITAAFAPDGRHVVSAGAEDGVVHVFDWRAGSEEATFSTGFYVSRAELDPRGQVVAVSGSDGRIRLWRWRKNDDAYEADAVLRGHEKDATGLAFTRDGRYLVTGSADKTVRMWSWQAYLHGKKPEPRVLRGHTGVVFSVAVSPLGDRIASASSDGTVRVWDMNGKELHSLPGPTAKSVAFTADGARVVAAGADGATRVWDARTGRLLGVLHMHGNLVNAVSINSRTREILTAADDGTAKIYRCETCGPLDELRATAKARVARLSAKAKAG